MLFSILALIALPFIVLPDLRSLDFRPLARVAFWIFVFDTFILGWLGAKPASYPFTLVGQLATFLYFFLLLVVFPLLARFESLLWSDFYNERFRNE